MLYQLSYLGVTATGAYRGKGVILSSRAYAPPTTSYARISFSSIEPSIFSTSCQHVFRSKSRVRLTISLKGWILVDLVPILFYRMSRAYTIVR